MSRYSPVTGDEQAEMLRSVGVTGMGDLFAPIPESLRLKQPLNIPGPYSEIELKSWFRQKTAGNANVEDYTCFLGAGAYDHAIPSVINHLLLRQEFYTSYTPYQPEISQGTLQSIFEYQTMICRLTGLDAANASLYDGATAVAEAALMACQHTRRQEIVYASGLHPHCREILQTYARFAGMDLTAVAIEDGVTDFSDLERKISAGTAAVIVQSPNVFGLIEDLEQAAGLAAAKGALMIASVDPISLALLAAPGQLGVDIAVGEGQPLGMPLNFGGPSLGFMAVRGKLTRRMPGRIVGETVDKNGRCCYVLTIQAREQHIRREKATSNICTNQALNALAAGIYLSLLGPEGLYEVAEQCLQKAHYAYQALIGTGRFEPVFTGPFFREFAVRSKRPVGELNDKLLQEKIIGGLDLGTWYPGFDNVWLLAVTEKRSKDEIDNFVAKAVRI